MIDQEDPHDRLRVVTLYIQAKRYRDALIELEATMKDFPQLRDLETQRKRLYQLVAEDVIREIESRRDAGQHSDHGLRRGTRRAGDVAAVTAAFADDIAWTEADGFPLAGTYIGPQAVVENVFMRLGEFSDNWGVVVERLVADGDTVVADGKYTWDHKKSGEPCEARMAHVWTLADGRATSFLQHVYTLRVREQIE